MHIVYLTKPEKEVLEQHIKRGLIPTIRLRAHAILMRDARLELTEISRLIFRDETTVSRWIREFSKSRLASIFSGHISNENASKLTREQKEEIKKVLGAPPDQYGIPKEFWDVPKLKKYLEVEFDVKYESESSYYFLLKFSGLSFKYPDKLSPRRDNKVIENRMIEIKKEIKPLLSSHSWVVFASDETRLQKEAEIRRAWLVKGKRTVIKTEKSKEHQNYLGFLNQKTYQCQVFEIKGGNTTETIRILRNLTQQYPDKRICIIWDNAKWHRSKLLREQLAKGKSLERIHLIALPPYAPDHNPIEHVWGYAKSKLANKSNQAFSTTKQQFMQLTNNRIFEYHI